MANIEPRKNKDGKIISYRIKVYKGRDESGKRLKPDTMTWKIPQNLSETKIQKELNRVATLFEENCKKGLVVDNRQTFSQYAKYVIHLKENVEKKKHSTIKRYNELLERINPAIGHIKLADLKPQHLNKFYEQLSMPGMNLSTGEFLSTKTILEHHRLIHTILAQADKEMLVTYNAANKATPPAINEAEKQKKRNVAYLDDEQIRYILKWVTNEPLKWQVVINLLAFTGGRRGEIAGLKVDKINFKENTIHFAENLLYSSEKGIYQTSLKTNSSDRILELPQEPMKLIEKLVRENKRKILTLGNKWNDTGYLLTQENGLPMHPDSITGYCSDFMKKYNKVITEQNKNLPKEKQLKLIPKMNPHAFRHAQASILAYYGVDVVSISGFLGHANPNVTQSIYQHVFKKANSKIARLNSDILLNSHPNVTQNEKIS